MLGFSRFPVGHPEHEHCTCGIDIKLIYRMNHHLANHLLANLGLVDYDLDIPPILSTCLSPFCQTLICQSRIKIYQAKSKSNHPRSERWWLAHPVLSASMKFYFYHKLCPPSTFIVPRTRTARRTGACYIRTSVSKRTHR